MIALTGANGFVGTAVLARLRAEGFGVRPFSRSAHAGFVETGDIATQDDWPALLKGCDTVVHLAARVHVMKEADADPLAAFRAVNVEGTVALARGAVAAGARRFVFVSSIKVLGEESPNGRPFRADDLPQPADPYGVSKLEAERTLAELGRRTGLEVVIIRPPLVYGPGVKANFAAMMRLVRRGVPLPLGAVDNRRSLVALDNLADLIAVAAKHENAPGKTFLVSDGDDVSTPELLRRIGRAMGRPVRLLPVPENILRKGAGLLGRGDLADRLLGSLAVDISETRRVLDWSPPVSMDAALGGTVRAFLETGRRGGGV